MINVFDPRTGVVEVGGISVSLRADWYTMQVSGQPARAVTQGNPLIKKKRERDRKK